MKSPESSAAPRKSPVPVIILLIAVIAAIVPFMLVKGGNDIITWRTDLDAAFAEAKQTNKPLLLDFTADWCPPCKMMKRQTFSQQKVKDYVEANYIPVRLDMTQRNAATQQLGGRFSIQYLPTFLVLSPDGKEQRRESGGMDADAFLKWLGQES